MEWGDDYQELVAHYAANVQEIIDVEKGVRDLLVSVILDVAPGIEMDWNHAEETLPCWIERAPKQRGRAPSGTGIPWIEVAEYVPLTRISSELGRRQGDDISFPGLPTGGDLRVATGPVLIHLDAKAAGPNDRHDEVVVPPYQVSGDGEVDKNGSLAPQPTIRNSAIQFPGGPQRRGGVFYPSLPPIYLYPNGSHRLCVTAFLKVVYTIAGLGIQPLDHMTLALVPNGILLAQGGLGQTQELFARGKDDSSKDPEDARCRVMFDPLRRIASWRVTTIKRDSSGLWAIEGDQEN